MPRVLLVSYEFPPKGGPGVQRPLKLAKYLGRFGWDVSVLTVRDPVSTMMDPSLLAELPSSVSVIDAWSLEPSRLVRSIRRARPTSQEPGVARQSTGSLTSAPGWLIRSVQGMLVPDEKRLWKPYAVRAARRHGREEGAYDVVISTGPPHTAHVVGSKLASKWGAPHVVDLRDPWVGGLATRVISPVHKLWHAHLERHIFERAAAIVCVTEVMADDVRRRYPDIDKVAVVPNGFDPDDLTIEAEQRPSALMRIAYVGTFGPYRSPEPLFRGIASAEDAVPDLVSASEWVFVGSGPEIEQQARAAGVRSSVTARGYLDHRDALAELAAADVALLFLSSGPESEVSLTGKVFEYLGMRKPILAIVGEGAVRSQFGDMRGFSFAHPDAPDEVTAVLRRLHDEWRRGELQGPPEDSVRRYDRIEQAQEYSRLLNGIIA